MGESALQREVVVALLLSAGLAGAAEGFLPATERADDIRQLNRRALEQLPAGVVPSNGSVCVEAEVVPTKTAKDVQLRHWQVASPSCQTNASAVVATNTAVPVRAGEATSIHDRIRNRRLPMDGNNEQP